MSKKDLFESSSSSSSHDDDDELTQQMTTAAIREQRRNPHGYGPFVNMQKKNMTSIDNNNIHTKRNKINKKELTDDEENIVKGSSELILKTTREVKKSSKNKEEDKNDGEGIRINKQYAAKYEEVKRRKELQRLTEKYGKRVHFDNVDNNNDEDDDEEDEEDDGAFLLTKQKELAFAKAFYAIRQAAIKQKKKQQEQMDKDTCTQEKEGEKDDDDLISKATFFPPEEEQIRENTQVFAQAVAMKRKQRNKFTLADEYRRGIVENVEEHIDNMKDNNEKNISPYTQGNHRIQPQSDKERRLRDAFLQNVSESTETFVVRPVITSQDEEKQKDDDDDEKICEEAKKLLAGAFCIRNTDDDNNNNNNTTVIENEDPDEAFLRDFFVEELWKPKSKKPKQLNNNNEDDDEDEEEEINNYAVLAELAQAEEDERFYAHVDSWERAYQDRMYHHQEEEAEHIQSFPRPIGEHAAGLLRKNLISSRKESRLRRIERIEELKRQQVEELRRLKTLKRQEIEAQRALIASVAGITKDMNSDGNKSSLTSTTTKKKKNEEKKEKTTTTRSNEDEDVARLKELWSEKDLEEEFDPKKFDKKMAQLFNDDYYNEKNVDEEEMAFFEEELDDDDNNNNGLMKGNHKNNNNGDGDGIVDDALELLYPSLSIYTEENVSGKGSREHIENMIQQQQRKEETDGMEKDKSNKNNILHRLQTELKEKEEEYWNLHHESTLDGGQLKTRFKYRDVPPEDFTLSVEEILTRDDRQLNMMVPMNCYAAYLGEEANRRDRAKTERWRRRGFREIDSSRKSRRYGDVSKTILVNAHMDKEEGEKWAKQVRKRLSQLNETIEENNTSVHKEDKNNIILDNQKQKKKRRKREENSHN